ncbi:MAG: hypothetical protein ACNA8W_25715 [Bradymonadaceae bacterium]
MNKQKKTPSAATPEAMNKQNQIIGGPTARQVFRQGGLADRLRAIRKNQPRPKDNIYVLDLEAAKAAYTIRDNPPTCPSCHAQDPGFADSDHPDQAVACDFCGHETTYKEWT